MPAPIAVSCPHCNHPGHVPASAAGRRARCPRCKRPFLVLVAEDDLEEAAPDAATPRPRRPGVSGARVATAALRGLAWLACLGWCAVVVAVYLAGLRAAQNVFQEVDASAAACLAVLVGYVCARAIDSGSRW
jgi:hypothetical protein